MNSLSQLWPIHEQYRQSAAVNKQQMRAIREQLGKLFYELKQTLAVPGRGGQWSQWLKKNNIPRASADRYALAYHRSITPSENLLTEEISAPTPLEVGRLLPSIRPRLMTKLTTPESQYLFVRLFLITSGLQCFLRESGIVIFDPAHTGADQPRTTVDLHQAAIAAGLESAAEQPEGMSCSAMTSLRIKGCSSLAVNRLTAFFLVEALPHLSVA